jgi:hypothetical protein
MGPSEDGPDRSILLYYLGFRLKSEVHRLLLLSLPFCAMLAPVGLESTLVEHVGAKLVSLKSCETESSAGHATHRDTRLTLHAHAGHHGVHGHIRHAHWAIHRHHVVHIRTSPTSHGHVSSSHAVAHHTAPVVVEAKIICHAHAAVGVVVVP